MQFPEFVLYLYERIKQFRLDWQHHSRENADRSTSTVCTVLEQIRPETNEETSTSEESVLNYENERAPNNGENISYFSRDSEKWRLLLQWMDKVDMKMDKIDMKLNEFQRKHEKIDARIYSLENINSSIHHRHYASKRTNRGKSNIPAPIQNDKTNC